MSRKFTLANITTSANLFYNSSALALFKHDSVNLIAVQFEYVPWLAPDWLATCVVRIVIAWLVCCSPFTDGVMALQLRASRTLSATEPCITLIREFKQGPFTERVPVLRAARASFTAVATPLHTSETHLTLRQLQYRSSNPFLTIAMM